MPSDAKHTEVRRGGVVARVKRLPLRIRLTASFATVMAVVLVLGGGFVFVQLDRSLGDTTTLGLRSRAQDLRDSTSQATQGLPQGASTLTEQGESIAQRLGADGRVVDATPGLRDRSLLTGKELQSVLAGRELLVERESTPAGDDPVRLLAVRMSDGTEVLVVGASIEESREALTDLAQLLLIGGPFVLLLASLAGYLLAGAALRPVEAMRARAESISAHEPGARLPVPESEDEIRRLGNTLNDLLARLEAAVEVERSFVADASHELRTPLAILKAELEFALRPARTAEERHEALGAAAEETDRLVRLSEDLLVIARAQGGQLAIRRSAIAVDDVLAAVVGRFGRAAETAGVDLAVDAPAGLELWADRSRIEQAIGNLIDNALGHGATTVVVAAEASDGKLLLRVSDDGDGFPADFLGQAFDRFSRADKARQRGGSGLGLAIVEAVVTAHGGAVAAANGKPVGAVVSISLPLAERTRPSADGDGDDRLPARGTGDPADPTVATNPSNRPGGDAHARADR